MNKTVPGLSLPYYFIVVFISPSSGAAYPNVFNH
jgi:hypothetical protein